MKSLKQYLLSPKTSRGFGLVTLILALAWPACGADLDLIGQWASWPRGWAYGVAVSGNYAYVADGRRWTGPGILDPSKVIDVSNPANPQRVGGYDTSGHAYDVVVSGNYAYVADLEWGLMILGPRTPRITSLTRAAGRRLELH